MPDGSLSGPCITSIRGPWCPGNSIMGAFITAVKRRVLIGYKIGYSGDMDKLGALKSDYDFVGNGRQYGRKRWEPVPEEDRKHELFYVTYSRYVLRGGFDVADGWLRTKGLTDSQIDRYRERWKDRNKEKAS